MIRCPQCGRDNEASYRFCLGCGQPLGQAGGGMAAAPGRPDEPAPTAMGRKPVLGPSRKPADVERPASGASSRPQVRICQMCDRPIADGNVYCGNCGARHEQPANRPPSGASQRGVPLAPRRAPPPVSPRRQRSAYLVQIRSDGQEGNQLPISTASLCAGRTVGGEMFEGDPFLSPLHATFWLNSHGQILVRDESSLNGTFLRVREPVALAQHDVFRIGQEILRFERLKPSTMVKPQPDGTMRLGSPISGAWGRLCVLVAPGRISDAYLLTGKSIRLGRERGEVRFPEDGFVSGIHAEVARDGDQIVLRDLGSSNGTFISVRQETVLQDGDFLLLGQQLFLVKAEAA